MVVLRALRTLRNFQIRLLKVTISNKKVIEYAADYLIVILGLEGAGSVPKEPKKEKKKK